MSPRGVPRRLGRNNLDTDPVVRHVARFFRQLATRGFFGRFVRLDHSGWKLEARAGDAVAVLPHQNHFGSLRDTKHAGPIGTMNDVEALDLVTVAETHVIFSKLQPALADEQLAAEDLPRFHATLVTRLAVR